MKITIKQGSLTDQEVDAIVNPANSYGVMGGGVAAVIKREGGKYIEKEAIAKKVIHLGNAVITTAGKLRCKHVIHAPTMQMPAEKIPVENVEKATLAALRCADENKLETIAMPGMGTGVGGVKPEDAANAMIQTIKSFHSGSLKEVILVDIDENMVNAFENQL